jgi:pimeloyl-ACP methyl ester carboxylesterase
MRTHEDELGWRQEPGAAAFGLTAMESGEGPRLVLVHGSLGDYRQWTAIGARLSTHYRVVAISRRYHWPNATPSAGAPYTYEGHRDDLLAYLRASEGPVHLAGHSYGAGIVLLAALREPDLVSRLILVEPPFGSLLPPATADIEGEMADRLSMLQSLQDLARTGNDIDASRLLTDWIQGGPGGFAALAREVQDALLQNAATVGPTFSAPPPHVDCEALHALRAPTLVLNGERTRLFYRVVGECAAACVPGARRAWIAGAAHMTIVERPDETAALMMEFLDEGIP